nr:MAG TPA: hypothetical protein [Caudoviricetes sp.]
MAGGTSNFNDECVLWCQTMESHVSIIMYDFKEGRNHMDTVIVVS